MEGNASQFVWTFSVKNNNVLCSRQAFTLPKFVGKYINNNNNNYNNNNGCAFVLT